MAVWPPEVAETGGRMVFRAIGAIYLFDVKLRKVLLTAVVDS